MNLERFPSTALPLTLSVAALLNSPAASARNSVYDVLSAANTNEAELVNAANTNEAEALTSAPTAPALIQFRPKLSSLFSLPPEVFYKKAETLSDQKPTIEIASSTQLSPEEEISRPAKPTLWTMEGVLNTREINGPIMPGPTPGPWGLRHALASIQKVADPNSRFHFELAVQAGTVGAETAPQPGMPGAQIFQFIPRLNIGYKGEKIDVTLGEQAFSSGFGSDRLDGLYRTFGLQQASLPYRLPGLKFDTEINDRQALQLWLVEGSQLAGDKRASIAGVLGHKWMPLSDFTLESYFWLANKAKQLDDQAQLNGLRIGGEVKATKNIGRANVGTLFNVVGDHYSKRPLDYWLTAGLFLDGQVLPNNPVWKSALRAEFVSDPHNLALLGPEGGKFVKLSHAHNFWVHPNWLLGIEAGVNMNDRSVPSVYSMLSGTAILNQPLRGKNFRK